MHVQEAYDLWSASYDADHNLTRDLDRIKTAACLGQMRCRAVLEIGCGTGKNTPLLAQIAESVTAVDFSAGMIAQAQDKVQAKNVIFKKADITQPWPVAAGSHNLITCNLILEHVADLAFIFAQAKRALTPGGQLYVSELHPFRQYRGSVARFQQGETTTHIPAFVHHISDFLQAAKENELSLLALNEYWHEQDKGKLPRLLTLLFVK